MRLSNATLHELPRNIRVPRYDRSHLSAGIVHIGLGNFHRAHQAWYSHRLFDSGLCHDWAILGAGVRPADALQRERLKQQDCLTTLIELDPSGRSVEICGSMIDFIPVADNNAPLIARMSQADIRIVSLTVTEGDTTSIRPAAVSTPLIRTSFMTRSTPTSQKQLSAR